MTVETHTTSPSASEIAKQALRSMMPPEPNRALDRGFAVREPEQHPPEAPPFRWPRVFPGL